MGHELVLLAGARTPIDAFGGVFKDVNGRGTGDGHAGMPESLPAHTVNKVCGSGLEAVMLAAYE